MKFSANLGFLWSELSLEKRCEAAAKAGFSAVEFHWPYAVDAYVMRDVLARCGLTALGLNTRLGAQQGDFGVSAIPGRADEARAHIDEAIEYAAIIGSPNIHVMAGLVQRDAAHAQFVENLRYATQKAGDKVIIIEPINTHDVPGYFLGSCAQARQICKDVGAENLKLLFDCYHVARMGGDLYQQLQEFFYDIAHIQFAGVPTRGNPDEGDVAYQEVFSYLDRIGYQGWLGAEYRPNGRTEDTLTWKRWGGAAGTV
ncbi:MAG: TIM barrel protein [Pseudomonadota bacterium]